MPTHPPEVQERIKAEEKSNHRSKWTVALIYAPLTALLAAVTISNAWPWSNITFTPFQTDKATYQQGEVVTLTNQFCWRPGLTGQGQRFVSQRFFVTSGDVVEYGVGTIGFNRWPDGADYTEANDYCNDARVRIQIPFVLPPGTWHVVYETTYDPTPGIIPFDSITQRNTSNPFTVTPGPQLPLGDTTPSSN